MGYLDVWLSIKNIYNVSHNPCIFQLAIQSTSDVRFDLPTFGSVYNYSQYSYFYTVVVKIR